MGAGSSKPHYVLKASRTECSYSSNNGKWVCDTVRLNNKNKTTVNVVNEGGDAAKQKRHSKTRTKTKTMTKTKKKT